MPTVAVVGSGMAGLVTAYLLNRDPKYDVEIFENVSLTSPIAEQAGLSLQGEQASLDSASVSVWDSEKGHHRIDVPMRAFSEGYYPALKAMYDFLHVRYQRQRMIFSFSADAAPSFPDNKAHAAQSPSTYFLHADNHHAFPPLRPQNVSVYSYVVELAFVGICHIWFSLCCRFFNANDKEALGQYFQRIYLPQHFVRYYILPLLSAISTCSHDELLNFPARDVVDYRRRIQGGEQFVVSNGVSSVQKVLLAGLNITYNARVESVESDGPKRIVVWTQTCNGKVRRLRKQFDEVILAVPPNIVAQIFEPARRVSSIPTASVRTVTHGGLTSSHKSDRHAAQTIYLRTFSDPVMITEATHVHDTGVRVTTSPQTSIDASTVRDEHSFTRVLRTVESRKVVNELLGHRPQFAGSDRKWCNGEQGVWLVGAWCWDGMVLLEGCIISAMRTAQALQVDIPW